MILWMRLQTAAGNFLSMIERQATNVALKPTLLACGLTIRWPDLDYRHRAQLLPWSPMLTAKQREYDISVYRWKFRQRTSR